MESPPALANPVSLRAQRKSSVWSQQSPSCASKAGCETFSFYCFIKETKENPVQSDTTVVLSARRVRSSACRVRSSACRVCGSVSRVRLTLFPAAVHQSVISYVSVRTAAGSDQPYGGVSLISCRV